MPQGREKMIMSGMDRLFVFDFDGVIAFLFDDYDLAPAEREMERCMLSRGIDISGHGNIFTVPGLIAGSDAGGCGRTGALIECDRILGSAEADAALSAEAVPGFIEMLPRIMESGTGVAVASNNDPRAVRIFLNRVMPGLDIPVWGR